MENDQPRDKKQPRGTQSISRAISLLRKVAETEDSGITLSRLTKSLDIHPSTAHRILQLLVAENFVSFNPETKLYHLGLEIYRLGRSIYGNTLRERFRGFLDKTVEYTEDTVYLIVRAYNEAICVDRVEGKYPIRTLTFDVGSRRLLGIGGGALSILAYLPEDEREAMIETNRPAYPRFNDMSAEKVRQAVKETRLRGYAYTCGNLFSGTNAVGVPIMDFDENLQASITVSAVDQRLGLERAREIANFIKAEITEAGLFTP